MNLIDVSIKYLGYFTALILASLVLLVVYDASARYLFSSGSIALQELEWHLFDFVILFGISYTLSQNAHVRVDIFYEEFSKKTKFIINIISVLVFILPFSMLIIYLGFDFVLLSFEQNEISSNPGGLEYRFIVKAFMPISFVFLLLQGIRQLSQDFEALR